jgi:hypothetical protein
MKAAKRLARLQSLLARIMHTLDRARWGDERNTKEQPNFRVPATAS